MNELIHKFCESQLVPWDTSNIHSYNTDNIPKQSNNNNTYTKPHNKDPLVGSFSFNFPIIDKTGKSNINTVDFDFFCDNKSTNSSNNDDHIFNLSVKMFGQKIGMNTKISNDNKTVDMNFYNINTRDNNANTNTNNYNEQYNINIDYTYEDDLDINQIHNRILDKLSNESGSKLDKLNKHLEHEKKIVLGSQTIGERKKSIECINDIQSKMENIYNKLEYNKYVEKSKDILIKYNQIESTDQIIEFNDIDKYDEQKNIQYNEYKHELIEQYIFIASKYINLNISHKIKEIENICPSCKNILNKSLLINIDGMLMCPDCNIEIQLYTGAYDYDNSDISSMLSNKASSNDINNYLNRIEDFEAKEPNKYPANIEIILDTYFIEHNMDICKIVRLYPFNSDGRTKGNTSKKMMINTLKNLKYKLPKMRKHIEWICVEYWGWRRHNLSDYKIAIISNYSNMQDIINNNKGIRKSNLNRDYRLYRDLEKIKYPYLNINDFLITNEESLHYHENMFFNNIIPGLGWDKDLSYKPVRMISLLLNS